MKKLPLCLALFTLLAFASCNQPAKTNSDQANSEMSKSAEKDKGAEMKARFNILNDCFNSGNTSAIDTLLAATAIDHSEDTSMHLPKGPEGLKQFITMFRQASPDLKSEIKIMVAEGDILTAYGTVSGTNSGMMMGMPATNKKWSADFVDIIKFGSDMKMIEHWGVFDTFKMMRDLGMIPMGPPPPDKTKAKK
jgi:predicted ester cyclase